jgi:hypothetical protein
LKSHRIFRGTWWACNLLLALALLASVCSGVWEISVRRYLKGFSDAIIPEASSPRDKAEAILAWMLNGPPRLETVHPAQLSARDPSDTLNYRQLLQVCGSATNAFLNLARSSGLPARRLLLLTPERSTKHVVAEVNIDGRWVIADPTYRVFLKDAQGNLLTRKDLQNPVIFEQARSVLPQYPAEYTFEHFAHVRVSAFPLYGATVRSALDRLVPAWDEYLEWSLLLERRSFAYFSVSLCSLLCLLVLRLMLAWWADHRLRVPRFRLRANLSRATAAFFTTPEIK